jgi:hypothetical protein
MFEFLLALVKCSLLVCPPGFLLPHMLIVLPATLEMHKLFHLAHITAALGFQFFLAGLGLPSLEV